MLRTAVRPFGGEVKKEKKWNECGDVAGKEREKRNNKMLKAGNKARALNRKKERKKDEFLFLLLANLKVNKNLKKQDTKEAKYV